MEIIQNNIDKASEVFKNNEQFNQNCLSVLNQKMSQVKNRQNDKASIRHKSRGKLLAQERIDLLVDEHTPFLEFSALAAIDQYKDAFPSAGIITGIGVIHGKETVIIANDATVKGGTYVKETIKKHIRALEIAINNQLPTVYLVDSGGIFLPEQVNVFADKEHFGRIFYLQAQLSAQSIPQIALVMGLCTAGGAYVPAMSSETIMVKEQGTIFLGGPPLVKAATGEEVNAEELGGAEVHTSISGVADYMVDNDVEATALCRELFETLNVPAAHQPKNYRNPLYNTEDILGLIAADSKNSTDVYQIIARLVDGSAFREFKPNYGKTIITGYANLFGERIGIIANNGILFPEAAQKATHFIELCNHKQTPILFLQNITGFMVGKAYEHQGIVKEGAKMVQAVANAVVPKITVIIGGSFGAGNYAMSGRAYNPDFLFMWPNAKIGVMGGEQAANVLVTVKRDQLNKAGAEINEEELKSLYDKTIEQYEQQNSCYFSTSRLWDDGVISPLDTRAILGMAFSVCKKRAIEKPNSGIYRM